MTTAAIGAPAYENNISFSIYIWYAWSAGLTTVILSVCFTLERPDANEIGKEELKIMTVVVTFRALKYSYVKLSSRPENSRIRRNFENWVTIVFYFLFMKRIYFAEDHCGKFFLTAMRKWELKGRTNFFFTYRYKSKRIDVSDKLTWLVPRYHRTCEIIERKFAKKSYKHFFIIFRGVFVIRCYFQSSLVLSIKKLGQYAVILCYNCFNSLILCLWDFYHFKTTVCFKQTMQSRCFVRIILLGT